MKVDELDCRLSPPPLDELDCRLSPPHPATCPSALLGSGNTSLPKIGSTTRSI